ncbi:MULTISPECIES: arsenic resistance N-acetyltransferase ArsN2 [Sphingomonas]|uniref:Arsenic resistance N-acetyltransferase ArsN2 n=1 Tax=Sphingomonas molluscorum TaxID=418184 RepID=A0ABU8Q9X2_9SPHN|nr:arsenic resistance N-acetyltransferase ArsN2 [Sphingomonas sp. JUb134]MBM7407911.1 amino-acid N-acetyltransferase [Sphingomonas sp. JUb134]
MTALRVTALDPDNLGGLRDALAASGLPVADLVDSNRAFFRFDNDAGLVGYGGLEGHGADRLLRLLLVVADRRGDGLGRAMLGLLEARARKLSVARLHLLTNTAAPFFTANSYAAADRATAPASIAGSREFTALCPASAAYLVKAL